MLPLVIEDNDISQLGKDLYGATGFPTLHSALVTNGRCNTSDDAVDTHRVPLHAGIFVSGGKDLHFDTVDNNLHHCVVALRFHQHIGGRVVGQIFKENHCAIVADTNSSVHVIDSIFHGPQRAGLTGATRSLGENAYRYEDLAVERISQCGVLIHNSELMLKGSAFADYTEHGCGAVICGVTASAEVVNNRFEHNFVGLAVADATSLKVRPERLLHMLSLAFCALTLLV